MKCDLCGQAEALIYIQQQSLNVKTELRLCPACAASQGLSAIDGELSASLSKLMESVGHPAVAKPAVEKAQSADGRACPSCGVTLSELRKRGLAGCSGCWNTFGALLLHEKPSRKSPVRYQGRLPLRLENSRFLIDALAVLRSELKVALQNEDYETAASCRDRIRALEGETSRAP